MLRKIPFSKARSSLTAIVNFVAFKHDRFTLTRNGKELAAIVSMEDLRTLEELEDKKDIQTARLVDEDIEQYGTISWEDAQKELGL